jgi:hypothetical protein
VKYELESERWLATIDTGEEKSRSGRERKRFL